MKMRQKVMLAELPLGLVAILLAAVGTLAVRSQGETAAHIVNDNYRSTLAAQRMKEALERIDSGALFILVGDPGRGIEQAHRNTVTFERELAVQCDNITEGGEKEATLALRESWLRYREAEEAFHANPTREQYFTRLEPRFIKVLRLADSVLDINQDAMMHKSEEARRMAHKQASFLVAACVGALCCGFAASNFLTRRLLRPLENLGVVAKHLGEGDLQVRATIIGTDEIARLGAEFNQMASRVEEYCQSSLGDLIQAQMASQAAIDSFTDPVWVLGSDGAVITYNEAAHLLSPILDVERWETFAQLNARLGDQLAPLWEQVIRRRCPWMPEGFKESLRIEMGDESRFYLPRATPLRASPDKITGLTLVMQDITRLRRIDELRDNMVATVAHEFKTPLTSLQMALHLCLEGTAGEMSEAQLDLLSVARSDCERLRTIVDDLLDLAHVQRGEVSLRRDMVGAQELIVWVIERFEREAVSKTIQLFCPHALVDAQVWADASKLQLVLANMVSNALRYTPPAGNVMVQAELCDESVRFSVKDTGGGVAPDDQARVFDRFFRAERSSDDGAGLGLSIAREIVQAHGGQIGVHSPPGSGATFWFTIPMNAVA